MWEKSNNLASIATWLVAESHFWYEIVPVPRKYPLSPVFSKLENAESRTDYCSAPVSLLWDFDWILTLVSNWILTSCQPHRVPSWRSNSVTIRRTFRISLGFLAVVFICRICLDCSDQMTCIRWYYCSAFPPSPYDDIPFSDLKPCVDKSLLEFWQSEWDEYHPNKNI